MISRGIAAFLGGFTILNLIGNLLAPGFDANIWWIDFSTLPRSIAIVGLSSGGIALLVFAIRPPRRMAWQLMTLAPIALLALVALSNGIRFYRLLHHHFITTSVPFPFSAIVFAALALIGWCLVRPSRRATTVRDRKIMALTFAACIVGFPLAQMYFFGHTDYRRKADVIVVFGARAHADGSPSGVLRDRVCTGCELYQRGLAKQLIFSGGPGDGAITEPEAMRNLAMQLGVPESAIIMDPDGVNTDATVQNTTALFRDSHVHRVLAVSHSYHLARIKMSYLQAGWNVYTIPAQENSGLPGGGRFLMFRELLALGAYYLHPLR